MKKPTEEVLSAIVRLKHGSGAHAEEDMGILMAWFSDSLLYLAVNGTNIISDVETRWNQGKCQNIREVVDIFNKAEGMLQVHRKTKL